MFHYCFITSYQRVNYLSENQRITKGNYQSLIIWRSLVQAQAGPLKIPVSASLAGIFPFYSHPPTRIKDN